ncbi:charged multivesicular body protein 6 [Patella vulgata]|uniref:charged multivesicular body protein 6 n=1 Tax=Patella vulgata TaxID=6465 RepID=UPI00218018DE|nr:charged multivesicular body protein 6 [Patella vulgata]
MGALFGKSKKASRVTEQDNAVLQLKIQRDKLKQYQKKITIQLEKERELARALLKEGKKDKAKLLLRKKKFQEGMLVKTDGQLDNIEQMVSNIEFAQIEAEVVKGLENGNNSLKRMHEMFSLDDVERIMDDTKDSIEYQQEINALISGGLTQEDEEDVLAELNEILQQSGESEENINLPDVPTDKLPSATKERERPSRQAVPAS